MKKEYTKPIIDTKAYAQFEKVFTSCNYNRRDDCTTGLDLPLIGRETTLYCTTEGS